MAIDYNRAISRLKARREEALARHTTISRQASQAMVEPTMAINRQIQKSVPMVGSSVGAQAQMMQDAAKNTETMQRNVQGAIPTPDTGQIDDQITNLEIAQEQDRSSRKNNALKTGLQIGGAIVGAGVGTAVGAGPLLGAQVGAGLGDMVSGFVGGGGDLALDYTNPEQVARGFADTIEGISSAVSLNQHKKVTKRLGLNFENLKKAGLMEGAYMAILNKDMDMLDSLLDQAEGYEQMMPMDNSTQLADGLQITPDGLEVNQAPVPNPEALTPPNPEDTPALEETSAPVFSMDAFNTIADRPAYRTMLSKLNSEFGGDINNPGFREWLTRTYRRRGTWEKFLRAYNAGKGANNGQ